MAENTGHLLTDFQSHMVNLTRADTNFYFMKVCNKHDPII